MNLYKVNLLKFVVLLILSFSMSARSIYKKAILFDLNGVLIESNLSAATYFLGVPQVATYMLSHFKTPKHLKKDIYSSQLKRCVFNKQI